MVSLFCRILLNRVQFWLDISLEFLKIKKSFDYLGRECRPCAENVSTHKKSYLHCLHCVFIVIQCRIENQLHVLLECLPSFGKVWAFPVQFERRNTCQIHSEMLTRFSLNIFFWHHVMVCIPRKRWRQNNVLFINFIKL